MSWKNELDRTLAATVWKVADDRSPDWPRLVTLANDLVAVSPSRAESHFLLGVVEELRSQRGAAAPAPAPVAPPAEAAAPAADAAGAPVATAVAEAPPPAPPVVLADSPAGDPALWRGLGRLDTAARTANVPRVKEITAEPWFETAVTRAREGRAALRAAGRPLVFAGDEDRALELYARHLAATHDEGSLRDAEVLLGDVVRRADDLLSDGRPDDAVALLARLCTWAEAAGLDARVTAKVERKLGRAHQLAGRWDEATAWYRKTLARLPADDRYRSVIHGDLALAALQIRGTLDLLPIADRPHAAEAQEILTQGGTHGEGESYNAIYTLGILAYERGDWANAAERLGEADRLMRESKAKARIVHARSRFFRGASLLKQGVTGESLAQAEQAITRDASASALEPAVKEPIFDLLAAAVPNARIPGRAAPRAAAVHYEGDRRDAPRSEAMRQDAPRLDMPRREGPSPMDRPRGGRGDRRPRADVFDRRDSGGRDSHRDAQQHAPRRDGGDHPGSGRGPSRDSDRRDAPAPMAAAPIAAAGHLADAIAALDTDPRQALLAVDRTFKSRPGFEEWFGAYRTRLIALLALNEKDEALRTYERFRAKLHERSRADRLEQLLLEPQGPVSRLFDAAGLSAERVDLYEVMPNREKEFAAECVSLAKHFLESNEPQGIAKAVALLREAVSRDSAEARAAYDDACARARAAGVMNDGPSADDVKSRIAAGGNATRIVVVGGDEARRPHVERLADLGRRVGFEGSWILAGARPYHQTLAEVEESIKRGASTILILHSATEDLRQGVKRLAEQMSIPVRDIPYTGVAGVEPEVLAALGRTFT